MLRSLASLALLVLLASPVRAAAPPVPPGAAQLEAAGVKLSPWRDGGGWAADVRDAASLTPEVWTALEAFPDVRRFSASGKAFDDAALARLARIKSLVSLFFNGPSITDAGLASLAGLPKLQRFAVDHSTVLTGSGMLALKQAPALVSIHFGGCIVGDAGVQAIAQLTQLKEVELGHDRITRASFPLLAQLHALEKLTITPNWDPRPYTAADFAAFAPMQHLRELEIHDMVLPWTGGLQHLQALKGLKLLKLYACYVSEPDAASLKAGLPGVTVEIKNPAGEDRLKQYQAALEKLHAAAKP